jgi:hypothetical protein
MESLQQQLVVWERKWNPCNNNNYSCHNLFSQILNLVVPQTLNLIVQFHDSIHILSTKMFVFIITI